MNNSIRRGIYILTAMTIIAAWWYGAKIIQDNQPVYSGLPYYGPDSLQTENYQVRNFTFINQDSQVITRALFENKIWISEFFFTTCGGICPVMNKNLSSIQKTFASDTNILFLSHTVNPETDNVSKLKSYAERHSAINGKWHFVTGETVYIYDLARTSYFSASPKDSTREEDFVHSQLFCLIDPHLHIRGYYDGTSGKDVKKLVEDIKLLKKEYELN